jgi:hypothetical protein
MPGIQSKYSLLSFPYQKVRVREDDFCKNENGLSENESRSTTVEIFIGL